MLSSGSKLATVTKDLSELQVLYKFWKMFSQHHLNRSSSTHTHTMLWIHGVCVCCVLLPICILIITVIISMGHQYNKLPKATTLINFGISSLWGPLLSGVVTLEESLLSGSKKCYIKMVRLGSFYKKNTKMEICFILNLSCCHIDPLHKWSLNLNNNTWYILTHTFMGNFFCLETWIWG